MNKVVVVEDEKLVRKGIIAGTDWSEINAVVVGEAADGKEGYEVIKKTMPDIVITDIRMPGMTGIEMIEKLKQEEIHPMTIFLTAYDDFSYAQKALRLEVADYILKPFEDGQLENTIKDILKRSNKWRQKEEVTLKKTEYSKYIMQAIQYIEANYANPDISVQAVAAEIGISEGHLSHLFRKETEFTFMNYVTRCRMKAAKKLLKSGKYKVYEVAEKVGYHDITYFSATFKKYEGISPSECQKN